MVNWASLFDKEMEKLPEGVAAFFVRKNDTVCVLVKAEGKKNHSPLLPNKWEILAAGIAFFNPNDLPEEFNCDKGNLIALGRALKNYHKTRVDKHVGTSIGKVVCVNNDGTSTVYFGNSIAQ